MTKINFSVSDMKMSFKALYYEQLRLKNPFFLLNYKSVPNVRYPYCNSYTFSFEGLPLLMSISLRMATCKFVDSEKGKEKLVNKENYLYHKR